LEKGSIEEFQLAEEEDNRAANFGFARFHQDISGQV
jgi:hypothetical protein